MIQRAEKLWLHDTSVADYQVLEYLLYEPEAYKQAPHAAWPLVLFLHGSGERGHNLRDVARYGLPRTIEDGTIFPFVAVSPQCQPSVWWNSDALTALLDHVMDTHTIDADRMYVTGLSMGGFGTWALAIAQPQRFAAIAPVCGGGDLGQVCAIAHLPIWVFHGARDEAVPLARSCELVNALYACGGNPRFTVYPDAGHDSWTETYANPVLYDWLLSHRRSGAVSS